MTHPVLLFDLDGTILDTTRVILESLRHASERVLGVVPEDAVFLARFGRPLEDNLAELAPNLTPDQVQTFVDVYLEYTRAHQDRLVAVVPGADRAVRRLAAVGRTLAVVTSKRKDLALHGLRRFGLEACFAAVVAREDTVRHKPDPAPLREALRQLGVTRRDAAVYIGDSPFDVRAARAAGVHAWGIVHNTFSAEDLRDQGAERVAFGWDQILAWCGA